MLVCGETGTGSGCAATALHGGSPRGDYRFVTSSRALTPVGLFECELVVCKKGAFSEAVNLEIGRVQLSNGGTFILDEAGDIPSELQSTLLRVLRQRACERLGND